MKKALFFISFIMFSSLIFCQENKNEVGQEIKNDVGLMITDLVNGSYSISYERALGKHFSAVLGVSYKTKDGLIKFSGLDTERIKTADITYSGLKLTPEVRYYIHEKEQGMLSGFYIGAYAKFVNYKTDLSGIYVDSEDISHDFLYEGKINVTSAGLMIGYKLPLTEHFNLDFLIAGPGAGFYVFKLNDVIPPPDEFYDDLNSALEKYSFLDFLNANFEFKKTSLKEKLILPTFRYAITLSYSF